MGSVEVGLSSRGAFSLSVWEYTLQPHHCIRLIACFLEHLEVENSCWAG